jgi:hypothetical protein
MLHSFSDGAPFLLVRLLWASNTTKEASRAPKKTKKGVRAKENEQTLKLFKNGGWN